MRLPLLFLLATCCLLAPDTRAQDAAPLPKPETQDLAPPGAATPAPTPELIPADILPPPDPAALPGTLDIPTIEQLDEGLKPPLSPAAEAHRLHLEWRKLRNQVQNEPRVKAALAQADAARTDLRRRKLLARYFELFYARMNATAPKEMKKYLLDRKREQLAALPQPNVRPETALATPTPAPAPAAGALPGASPTPTVSVSTYASPTPKPGRSGLLGLPRP